MMTFWVYNILCNDHAPFCPNFANNSLKILFVTKPDIICICWFWGVWKGSPPQKKTAWLRMYHYAKDSLIPLLKTWQVCWYPWLTSPSGPIRYSIVTSFFLLFTALKKRSKSPEPYVNLHDFTDNGQVISSQLCRSNSCHLSPSLHLHVLTEQLTYVQ